jgi:mannose-6-phosphate isomerase-like protein (cupin superfamily)
MGSEFPRPVLLRAGGGDTVTDGPARTIRILGDRDELTLSWFRYGAGQDGPKPHVHRRHTDAFYVLEGELELELGPDLQRVTGTAGTFAAVPANVVHTFRNASAATVVFLNIHAPSMGFGEMLRASRDGRRERARHFDQFEPPADGGRPPSDAVLRGPGEGESITLGGSRAVLKAEGSEADGFFSLSEMVLGPGVGGPVPHRHRELVDSFYVLEGTLALRLGDEQVEAGAGAFALVPPGNVHTFANPAEETVRLLNLMAPSGFEQYLKELAGAAPAGLPDHDVMAEIASRYDFERA